jgi:hypothetical protein
MEESGVEVLSRNVLTETEKYYEKYIAWSLGFETGASWIKGRNSIP